MNSALTICIPVYNCAEFIGQALDSILLQANNDIKVVIYDGGSTDSTPELLVGYVNAWPNIKYYRGDARGGIDADMVKCVGFAQTEYCWLFSGDDVMRPHAIETALEWIQGNHDIYICKHTICSKDMVVFREHPVLAPDQEFIANIGNLDERLDWFQRAVTTEAFFSFMSGLIVKRAKWLSGNLPEAFSKSCWGHVARFFGLIPSGLTVCYVPEVWLDQRGENDSFADRGIVNRFRIGIEGYHMIADSYFGHETAEAFHIRRVVRNEFGLAAFLSAKLQCKKRPDIEDRQLLDRLMEKTYCDRSLESFRRRLCYKMFPYWLFAVARPLYLMIKPFFRK